MSAPARQRQHMGEGPIDRANAALASLGVEAVFASVDRWRSRGAHWRASCPLHGGQSGGSLSVDAQTLVWSCWSGRCHGKGDGAGPLSFVAMDAGVLPLRAPLPKGPDLRRCLDVADRLLGRPEWAPPPRKGAGQRPTPPPPPPPAQRAPAPSEGHWRGGGPAQRAPRVEAPVAVDADDRTRALAALWQAADASVGTPAHAHLASRALWPPPDWRPTAAWPTPGPLAMPHDVRWAPAAIMPPMLGRGPQGAAGAILFAFREAPGAPIVAIQADALDAHGAHPADRWRRSLGPTAGAAFWAFGRSPEGVLVVVEGPTDALAMAHRPDALAACAVGGTAGMRAARTFARRVDAERVILAPDPDGPGRDAALDAVKALPLRERLAWGRIDGRADPADAHLDAMIALDMGEDGDAWGALYAAPAAAPAAAPPDESDPGVDASTPPLPPPVAPAPPEAAPPAPEAAAEAPLTPDDSDQQETLGFLRRDATPPHP